ncbi:hypothetical protein RN001_001333 [Aquatica leii]|uniref:Transmembrane protein 245 n=1 Tax=Aquatica leii TaxID=1421715 RepID=A0AAN7SJI9_9COLE|nr:hypothetical protein RN001_001333 [Aquatica leii]
MEYRSPLENVFSFISGLPRGHDKPVKHALYNAIALFALFLSCAASYALYVILGPFIKPLMWAVLAGSVLHPFKCSLAKKLKSWFNSMEESGTPIFIEVFIAPINIINSLSDFIGDKLLKYIKIIITIAVIIPLLHVIYNYTPTFCIYIIWSVCSYIHALIGLTIEHSTTRNIILLIIGYVTFTFAVWTPKNNMKFHLASIGVWLLFSCFFANQFNSFQIPIFVCIQMILLAGFIYEVYDTHKKILAEGHQVSIVDSLTAALDSFNCKFEAAAVDDREQKYNEEVENEERDKQNNSKTTTAKSETSTPKKKDPWSLELFEDNSNLKDTEGKFHDKEVEETNADKTPIITREHPVTSPSMSEIFQKKQREGSMLKFQRSQSQPYVTNWHVRSGPFHPRQMRFTKFTRGPKTSPVPYASDFYLYSLIWCCLIMLFWKNLMLLPILIIPIVIYVIKHLGIYLGLWNWLYGYWDKFYNHILKWSFDRYDALIPLPIRGLLKVMQKLNSAVKHSLKESIDTVASCVVILGLLIFVLCASVFIAIQIYAEAIMLVQMTGNLFNQTVVHNPELRQLLPPTFDDTMDSILDNAYQYGREGISKVVRGLVNDVDNVKSAKLEKQVLELWDRLYQTWMSSDNVHGPQVTTAAIQYSFDAFMDDIKKSPEMFNIQGITEFVKQNIGTFMSLLESVWSILKGNISLVVGSFSAFMSVLFGGGTAVLNFILNLIVFLTTLFYLLSSSGDLYKPVEFMTNFSTNGSRFGLALEGAVNGVFTATFKMAAFYGLWTWFIHNCFNVKIVYLPSALATILGAVPFLGTYWACLPAVLDLWLAQGKNLQAILFAVFQFLPTSIVDTTIYNEIQGGGHPYLTGLAIAGGIFCLGVEGAIIGPLLLCALYVVIDLSSSLFKESPSEETVSIPNIARI